MLRAPGRLLILLLACVCGGVLALHGYRANQAGAFFGGVGVVIAALGPLALALGYRHWPGTAQSVSLALSAVLAGLLALEVAVRRLEPPAPAVVEPVYSFAEARGNPEAFRRWWARFLAELRRANPTFLVRLPGTFLTRTLPGASGRLFDSEVRINRLGFRGPEIALEKGDAYRIVALGTSTTFGVTIAAGDRPWPELLQEMIEAELECARKVEVVNAGVPGVHLAANLLRLEPEILPIGPDLVISYHGYTGFRDLAPEVGRLGDAPRVPERPSILLARAEQALRLWTFRRSYLHTIEQQMSAAGGTLLQTEYADDYRRLAQVLRSRGIALVLCTSDLAVNAGSPEEVIRFYEGQFPHVRLVIAANQIHNRMVGELGKELGVPVVDATPGLDGAFADSYIDLVHHTPRGRERLARNVFEGLRGILAAEPKLACRPR